MSEVLELNSVMITGASRGIGLELLKTYLNKNTHHIIAVARDDKELQQFKNDRLTIIKADLVKDYESIVNQIVSLNPRLITLFNNAGIVINQPIENMVDSQLLPLMDINFYTPFKLIRDLKPFLIPRSHIINLSSMSGVQGSKKMKGLALYSASKAALASLTESVAEEFLPYHIYCNCIALGSVDTDMIKQSIPGFKPKINPIDLSAFLYDFANQGHKLCNGQIIPLTLDSF